MYHILLTDLINHTVSSSRKNVSTMSGTLLNHTFYVIFLFSEDILKRSENVAREDLASVGICFGKFTKTKKFKLHVTALDYLAQYAKVQCYSIFILAYFVFKYKIWIKTSAEMSYLYGNHVLKAHVAKMTEDVPEHQGVVVYSMNDIPLVS